MRGVVLVTPNGENARLEDERALPTTSQTEYVADFMGTLPEMLTPNQVAETLNISARSARELCAAGALRGAFKIGSTWRIPKDAIRHLMASGGIRCGSIRNLERCEATGRP